MRRIIATMKIALRALRRNKLRTLLTMLGMIIGVGAVIAMVGIGNGAKTQIENQIAGMGQNIVLVFSGSSSRTSSPTAALTSQRLKVASRLIMFCPPASALVHGVCRARIASNCTARAAGWGRIQIRFP